MIRYKLATQDYRTRVGFENETRWQFGVRVEATGDPKQGLCSDAYIHVYDDPALAMFLNPIHANIADPRILRVQCHGRSVNDCGLKRGYRAITPIGELQITPPSTTQAVAFGILVSLAVPQSDNYARWAHAWLAGADRSQGALVVASAAASAEWAAALAAESATREATWEATWAAALAAPLAARSAAEIDLCGIAQAAMQIT